MKTLLINGLTPKEYFRINGGLPIDSQEKLIDQHADLLRLLRVAYEVADELDQFAYQDKECFDPRRIGSFLASVRDLRGLV